MSDRTLYDEDILLWSEQQAAALRVLRQTGRIPNELDIDNVVEEIEALVRTEIAAVKSYLLQTLIHLLKLYTEPNSPAARHWLAEIVMLRAGATDRFAPSMRQRIDIQNSWKRALEQAAAAYGRDIAAALPRRSPFDLDDLLGDADPAALVARLRPPPR